MADNDIPSVLVDEYLTLVDDSCVALLPHVLRIAAEFRLADLLADGPMDVAALARTVGADAGALYRLLRALASVGFFEEVTPRTFALSALGRRLCSDSADTVRESVLQSDSYRAWATAADAFRKGAPVSLNGDGQDFFGHKDSDASADRSFTRRMRERAARCYAGVVDAVDWSRSTVVLDIGGGDGFLLGGILRREPRLTGVLFDRPAVVAAVESSGHLSYLAGRLRLAGGDFFRELPDGADTHLMCSVLHDWTDAQVELVLERSRAALAPHGRLLIVEMLVPDGNDWHPSKWSDLGMLVLTGGRERDGREFTDRLAAAGYAVSAMRPVPDSYFTLIEAESR
ncbi:MULTISPECIES: acetylserotonin O-methyltransferase [unclassified Nocardia]|uniref:acetylserotonin O-methyltransferase n=1 Tax=unclassified Nocardia TaxID=2637762 RepID=UPI001CE44776|nr:MULTISPECIES: acetylserotonin O-methyltransferase [unclassified Nocardia]